MAPGAYDGLSARLVAQAWFPAVYASGGAIARSAGVADLGLISMRAIVDQVASMAADMVLFKEGEALLDTEAYLDRGRLYAS